jgi:hypothetical protein
LALIADLVGVWFVSVARPRFIFASTQHRLPPQLWIALGLAGFSVALALG